MEYGNYNGIPPVVYNEDDIYVHAYDFTVYFYKYEPLAGSGYIEIPRWVKNSKSCVNIKNDDDKCFLWCHLRHRHPSAINQPNRISDLKPYENELNISLLTFLCS